MPFVLLPGRAGITMGIAFTLAPISNSVTLSDSESISGFNGDYEVYDSYEVYEEHEVNYIQSLNDSYK